MSENEISSMIEENKYLKSEVEKLYGIIRLLKKDKFGAKSEKVTNLEGQLLFNEIEKLTEGLQPAPKPTETITYTRKKKGKGVRKPFGEHVLRVEKIIDLKDEEKICPHDGHPLKEIGEDRSEKLKVVPAQMEVIVEIKKKYACSFCDGHMAQAKANSILPGTIATPELLSYIVFSKFFQALPLYRIEEFFDLQGIELTRGTMARWLVQVKDKLMPLYNLLQDKAFDSGYMAIDATKVQVLKEPGRKPQTKSFMWVRGSPEKGIVLFDYDISGSGEVAKRLMTGFSGALQGDAHRGYGVLDKKDMWLLGCLMHSRRRFHKAWLIGEKRPGLAQDALMMFQFLSDKEESYKEKNLTPDQRKYWRDLEVGPSMKAIKDWCEMNIVKVPKSSELGNALHYYINEYDELTAFLKDGRYEIDNGWVERVIRKFAIGRNNWLFCDTVDGAHASSVLYSLMITAKLNSKNPLEAMTEIFTHLPEANTVDDFEKLTELLLNPVQPLSCRKKDG